METPLTEHIRPEGEPLARAAFVDRRRLGALVEEHQRAGVEAEAAEILAQLLQALIQRVAVAIPAHLQLDGEAFDFARGQRPADQQVDATAAHRVLAVDRRHPAGCGLDLGAAVTPEGYKRTIDHAVQPGYTSNPGSAARLLDWPENLGA